MADQIDLDAVERETARFNSPYAFVILELVKEVRQRRAQANADRAVVVHLARLIRESADVRYYVGGAGSQMRELLLAAAAASGEPDPMQALTPPPHRRDDLTQVEQLRRQIDDLRAVNGGYRG